MKYALLVHNAALSEDAPPEEVHRATDAKVAEILGRPEVSSFLIVRDPATAITAHTEGSGTVTRPGAYEPGVAYVGGFILVDVDTLEDAVAIAKELQDTRSDGAIEVRGVLS